MPGRVKYSLIGVAICAATGGFCSCSKERGVEPVPQSYRLYVAGWGNEASIRIYDTGDDSFIDSTDAVPSNTVVRAASDGKHFLRFALPDCPELWDARQVTRIGTLPGCARIPDFATLDGLILGTSRARVDYISYPDLDLLGSDSIVLPGDPATFDPFVDQVRGLVFFQLAYGTSRTDSMDIAAWDYRNRQLYRKWDLGKVLHPGGRTFVSYTLIPGADHLFLVGSIPPTAYLSRMDLESGDVDWQMPINNRLALLRLTPDGKELWRAHWTAFDWGRVPCIYVHDPNTGAIVDSVQLPPVEPPLEGYPVIHDIVFTPDGLKCYAAAGDLFISSLYHQPVYIIDVKSHLITGTLQDSTRFPTYLAISPAP